MKRLPLLSIVLTVVLLAALAGPAVAQAPIPTATTWTSAIAYYNPDLAGDLVITYYNADGTVAFESDTISIAEHGSGTLMIGTTTLPEDFAGLIRRPAGGGLQTNAGRFQQRLLAGILQRLLS